MIQQLPFRLVRYGLDTLVANMLRDALAGAHGVLTAAEIGLLTAAPGFTLDMVIGDVTEATYDGYARQPVVWGAAGKDAQRRAFTLGTGLIFVPTGSTVNNIIVGAGLFSAHVAGSLIAVSFFGTHFQLGTPADEVEVIAKLSPPGTEAPDWGVGGALQ